MTDLPDPDPTVGYVRVVAGDPPMAHLAHPSALAGHVLCGRHGTHPWEVVHSIGEDTTTPTCRQCWHLAVDGWVAP